MQDDAAVTVEDYYRTMRELPGFAGVSEAELDTMAERACDLVATAIEAGESSEDAVDYVFQALAEADVPPEQALLGAVTLVGANCPLRGQ